MATKTETYQINVKANTKAAAKGINGLKTAMKGFVALLAAKAIVDFAKKIKDTTAEFENYRNKLRLVTTSQKDLNDTWKKLEQVAQDSRTSFGDIVDLYAKLAVSTEALGKTTEQVVRVTTNLSKALQLAGADGNTASSVIRQFGQAMASGEVRGDEFRSLVEGMGPALSLMARETGINVGQLRKMSQAGELTANVMFDMIENSTILEQAFSSMVPTIDQLELALDNAFDRVLVKIGEASGATEAYSGIVFGLTRMLDDMMDVGDLANAELPAEFVKIAEESNNGTLALKHFKSEYKDLVNSLNKIDQLRAGTFDGIGNATTEQFSVDAVLLFKDFNEEELRAALKTLEAMAKVEKDAAEELKRLDKIRKEALQAVTYLTEGHEEFTATLEKNLKLDYRSELEKQTEATKAQGIATRDLEDDLEALVLMELDETGVIQGTIDAKTKLLVESTRVHDAMIGQLAKLTFAELDREAARKKAIAAETQKIADAKKAANERVADIQREVASLIKVSDLQREINEINEDARVLNVEIKDAVQEQMEQQALLKQVELNRIAEVDKAKADAADREKDRKADEMAGFFDVNKKNFEVLSKYSKLAFNLNKALAIAEAIMGAKQAALNAFAFTMKVFPPLAPLAMAASYAATAATVAAIASQQYPGRAGGGPVQAGQSYMVGEGGRGEMFVPSQNGTIVPNSELNGSAINVNFQIDNVDATSFDELLLTRKNLIVSMVRQAVGQGRLG